MSEQRSVKWKRKDYNEDPVPVMKKFPTVVWGAMTLCGYVVVNAQSRGTDRDGFIYYLEEKVRDKANKGEQFNVFLVEDYRAPNEDHVLKFEKIVNNKSEFYKRKLFVVQAKEETTEEVRAACEFVAKELNELSRFKKSDSYGLATDWDRSMWNDLKPLNFYLLDDMVVDAIKGAYGEKDEDGREKVPDTMWKTWAETNARESLGYFGYPFPEIAMTELGYGSVSHLKQVERMTVIARAMASIKAQSGSEWAVGNCVSPSPEKAKRGKYM